MLAETSPSNVPVNGALQGASRTSASPQSAQVKTRSFRRMEHGPKLPRGGDTLLSAVEWMVCLL